MDYFTISRAKILSLLFHVSTLYISVLGQRSCPTSLDTTRIANHCPTNQDAWFRRERMFNCSSHKQNCTNPEFFVYHCIPNAWQNESIEVCAIRTTIIGWKCPEFNFGGKMVQEHNKGNCRLCPFQYNSTDAFKYRECFEFEKDSSLQIKYTTTSSKEPSSTTLASSLDCTGFRCLEVTLGFTVGVTAAAVLLIAAVSGFVIYKKRSGKDINSNQEKHLHKEADFKGYKSNDSEVEDILLEKGDTFKSTFSHFPTFIIYLVYFKQLIDKVINKFADNQCIIT
ncbi:uncharacterized protein LOC133200495 [Saccostrea echinata]|uniref:uncharacterized protein LOC133200495 n=1 Tax=Saccostrea echinata TaxID=191078 RepID=UPI002A7FB590|nr:uncharacterized protein LOC133200495 [Saccostrea echinata]